MKIAGSPSPPSRVVVVGDDQAGANIHTARARNTSRIRDPRARPQPPRQPAQAPPAGLPLFHRRHGLDRVDGRGRDDLLGRRPDG